MAYVVSIVLILFSALFSGLTLGLMGLDKHELERKVKLGDKSAKKVYRVRRRGNLLLTTLLLGNVGVNAILSIFLGSIATGVVAGFAAIALIFIFGEILPQAVISRHALAFGARTAWLVRIIIVLLYPVCGPIAWALDKMLGREMPTLYSRGELLSIIKEHGSSGESEIDRDEERIMKGALTFSKKKVKDVMTPKSIIKIVHLDEKLDDKLMNRLKNTGHSRVPVYNKTKDDVVGVLHVKDLVGHCSYNEKVSDIQRKSIEKVNVSAELDDVLNKFLQTRNHLFIAVNKKGKVEGLISIEDILEEIVGREIVDESDKHIDLRKEARRKSK